MHTKSILAPVFLGATALPAALAVANTPRGTALAPIKTGGQVGHYAGGPGHGDYDDQSPGAHSDMSSPGTERSVSPGASPMSHGASPASPSSKSISGMPADDSAPGSPAGSLASPARSKSPGRKSASSLHGSPKGSPTDGFGDMTPLSPHTQAAFMKALHQAYGSPASSPVAGAGEPRDHARAFPRGNANAGHLARRDPGFNIGKLFKMFLPFKRDLHELHRRDPGFNIGKLFKMFLPFKRELNDLARKDPRYSLDLPNASPLSTRSISGLTRRDPGFEGLVKMITDLKPLMDQTRGKQRREATASPHEPRAMKGPSPALVKFVQALGAEAANGAANQAGTAAVTAATQHQRRSSGDHAGLQRRDPSPEPFFGALLGPLMKVFTSVVPKVVSHSGQIAKAAKGAGKVAKGAKKANDGVQQYKQEKQRKQQQQQQGQRPRRRAVGVDRRSPEPEPEPFLGALLGLGAQAAMNAPKAAQEIKNTVTAKPGKKQDKFDEVTDKIAGVEKSVLGMFGL